jgi:hypothetical protein
MVVVNIPESITCTIDSSNAGEGLRAKFSQPTVSNPFIWYEQIAAHLSKPAAKTLGRDPLSV